LSGGCRDELEGEVKLDAGAEVNGDVWVSGVVRSDVEIGLPQPKAKIPNNRRKTDSLTKLPSFRAICCTWLLLSS
jgi:hypothetical protein